MSRQKLLIGLITVFTLVAIFFGTLSVASAAWCDSGYTRKIPLHINNTGGSVLTDYQINANVSYATNMSSDFKDFRIYNDSDCTLISHWNESWSSGVFCNLWFNATKIPASAWCNDTYSLYFKNASATHTSNITTTSIFGDDFNDGTIDATKWDTGNATGFSETGGLLIQNGLNQYYVLSKRPFDQGVSVMTRVIGVSNANIGHGEVGFFKSGFVGGGGGDFVDYYTDYWASIDNDMFGYDGTGTAPSGGAFDFNAWRTDELIAKNISTSIGAYDMYSLSAGENKNVFMYYNDSYIWATLYTSPGKIAKIDPTNPGAPTVYTLSAGHNLAYDICTGGGRVWSSLYSHEIVKMDPSDGSYVIYALGTNNPTQICYANNYLWIVHDAVTTKITKMNPTDGTYSEYTISGHHDACSAEFDGEWIWITGNSPPNGVLAKFNVNNNSYVVSGLNFNPNEAYWDGSYLWIGSWTSPAKLVKYDTSDNTYATFVTFDGGFNNIRDVTGDGSNRVWCAFDTTPTGRAALTYTNNGTVINTEFTGTAYGRSVTYDSVNDYAWAGFFTSPANYSKLTGTSISYVDKVQLTTSQGRGIEVSNTVSDEVVKLGRYAIGTPTGYSLEYHWDWLFTRKYEGIDPSVEFGAEEGEYGCTNPAITDVINGTPTNNTCLITWNVNQTADNRIKYSRYENLSLDIHYSYWYNNTNNVGITLSGLDASATYYYQAWSYTHSDPTNCSTNSTTYNFTTAGVPPPPPPPPEAPIAPYNPSPANGTTDVLYEADISWSCGADEDTYTYDVWFGLSAGGMLKCANNQTTLNFNPGTLEITTTYYWQIVAWNEYGSNTSDVWHFTTASYKFIDYDPSNLWDDWLGDKNESINTSSMALGITGIYTNIMGGMFFVVFFGLFYLVVWIRQENVIIPTMLAFISAGLVWTVAPMEFQQYAYLLFVIGVAGVIFSFFKGRSY